MHHDPQALANHHRDGVATITLGLANVPRLEAHVPPVSCYLQANTRVMKQLTKREKQLLAKEGYQMKLLQGSLHVTQRTCGDDVQ